MGDRLISVVSLFVVGEISLADAARHVGLAPEELVDRMEQDQDFAAALAQKADALSTSDWLLRRRAAKAMPEIVEKIAEEARTGLLRGPALVAAGRFLQEIAGDATPAPLVLDELGKPKGGYVAKLRALDKKRRNPM